MRLVILPLLLAACSRAPEQPALLAEPGFAQNAMQPSVSDMASRRLVGTWRPVLTPQEEADVWNSTRNMCFVVPPDRQTAIQRAISGCTVTFEADGAWSSAFLNDQSATAPLRWKTIEDNGEDCRIWLSTSPSGSECTVSCEFTSHDELIVRDGLPWFTRFVRVN